MKKLLQFLVTGLLLYSCSNDPIEVEDSFKATTMEIQKRAAADTILYKAVTIKNTTYLVNHNTYMVDKEISNDSGAINTLCVIILVLFILGFIVIPIWTS